MYYPSRYTVELRWLLDRGYELNLKNYPIFDESYRDTLNKKIIDHFFFREIGQETPDRFNFMLERKMNEIMPYYNKLYTTQLQDIDPLLTEYLTTGKTSNKAITKHENEGISGTYETSGGKVLSSINNAETENKQNQNTQESGQTSVTVTPTGGTRTTTTGTDSDNLDIYAYPSTQIGNDGNYITRAEHRSMPKNTTVTSEPTAGAKTQTVTQPGQTTETDIDTTENGTTISAANEQTNDTTAARSSTEKQENQVESQDENYTIQGRKGFSPADLIMKYRDTLLNIDLMIINQLEPLFMGVF